MRQNRVDPFGNFIRTPARGSLWGNRGALHNEIEEILRPFRLEQWITCTLDYKGIRRKIMAPNRLTELFFLDEATSFAAGHRPCALCRRSHYNNFKFFWLAGNEQFQFNSKTSIKDIDHVLHTQRIDRQMRKITFEEFPQALPDGAFVVYKNAPYLIKHHQMYEWTAFGYEKGIGLPNGDKLNVLTPRSVINTFISGYIPAMSIPHETNSLRRTQDSD